MKTCIIIGGGASINSGIELGLWDKIKDKDVWSINFAFMVMPFTPTRELFVDISFFKNNIQKLQELHRKGTRLFSKIHRTYLQIPEVKQNACSRIANDATQNDRIFIGNMGLSGVYALDIACREGYDNIYLLGYDFGTAKPSDKNTHFYQNNIKVDSQGIGRWEIYRDRDISKISKNVRDFEYFLKYKKNIINVSPESNIPYFPKITYQEMFEKLNNEN